MSLLNPEQRFELMVEQAIMNEELWSLETPQGLTRFRLEDGSLALPLWPTQEGAALESEGPPDTPKRLGLEELLESVLPEASGQGILVAAFPFQGEARVILAEELRARLAYEWEQDD